MTKTKNTMKKLYFSSLLSFITVILSAQTIICNSNGNSMIFTNYDGGYLNINVDVNIPNLKIGVVSYEGTIITLSGTYVNNVTAVSYAGYNSNNNHCGSSINTSIVGAPVTATTSIVLNPPVTLANSHGSSEIICGYSCSTTTSQGGCNTVDQIEAYFLNYFSGNLIYAHKVQYGCWLGTQNVSAGGTCCGLTTNLSDLLNNTDFTIYPNPAFSNLSIQTDEKIKSVRCQNYIGQSIELKSENNSIDISSLSEGLYFLNFTTQSGKMITKKFIKE